MGETRVELLHLPADRRRAYPGGPERPLLDPAFIEGVLRRQFQSLLDPALTEILAGRYPRDVDFVLNGARLVKQGWSAPDGAPIAVRLARKRKPAAAGYMVRDQRPLPEEQRGIAVSTFGKVIKRGWDWLGVTPAMAEHLGGLIEVPGLAECLTLNKADFVRGGPRGATYLAYRKAVQEAVSRQLALWGDARDAGEPARRRAARPVERDLEAVLIELADEFPLLTTLVEQRAGGQRRLPAARPGAGPDGGQGLATLLAASASNSAPDVREPAPPAPVGAETGEPVAGPLERAKPAQPSPPETRLPVPRGPRRPARDRL